MTDKELADFLAKRAEGRNHVFSSQALPEINRRATTVSLYREQLCAFRDHMAELQAFAAQVCGVPVDELCRWDMLKFLYERSQAEAKAGEGS